jgi:frataxin
MGDGQSDKAGTAFGNWIYMRDGTSLKELFKQELGIDFNLPNAEYSE